MSYNFKAMANSAKKLADYLTSKGVDAKVKTSRYQTQIKAVEVASSVPMEDLIASLSIQCTFSELTSVEEKTISGKYKAKLMKFTKQFEGISSGETLFILNTFTEKGSVKTKDLAPEKLGLTKSKYARVDDFDKDVFDGINYLKVPSQIKLALNALYENVASNKSNGDSIQLSDKSKKALTIIKPQDKQAIGKDFGEILSLRWYITQPFGNKYTNFYFSEISNEALVDYVVELKEKGKVIRKDVSAKFEAGAAPSIGTIADNIDKVYVNPSPAEKTACDVLKALAGLIKTGEKDTTSVKILAAYKTLDLPAYKKLKTIIGVRGDMTIRDIQEYIQDIAKKHENQKDRVAAFTKEFKEFYDVLGKSADASSLGIVFHNTTFPKYFSLILSPMGYALVDYMNKQSIYQEILNNISREMKTEQVYLKFNATSLDFNKKLFSKAEFKFAYGANAKNSDNTGIKFSMK
jgi:uncharacterized C2H2 Zn-finger protein